MVQSPKPRLEIRDFMNNKYMATLFIRSLLALQDRNATLLNSYTQIAAIHGSPTTFDGIRQGSSRNGYCPHGVLAFGPWHRPYLMMLERAIYDQARWFAVRYTTVDKANYVAAARDMRLPYWDWGRAGGQVPFFFYSSWYQVPMFDGTVRSVRNPLNRFTVPASAASSFELPPEEQSISRTWPDAPARTLTNIASIRSSLVSIFRTPSYDCFTGVRTTGCGIIGNLEGLHDGIHVGIGGQMGSVSYAAFDPIFFLHHCNVDRQLAIWEGLHPTVNLDAIAGTRAYPFYKAPNIWWTTRDLMNVYDPSRQGSRRFGYYYPEFSNPAVTPANVNATVNRLYNDEIRRPRIIATLSNVDTTPIDGTLTISLAPRSNFATTAATGSNQRGLVLAGSTTILRRDSSMQRFTVSRINVDITDALAKIKASPGITKIDIIATIKPLSSNTAATNLPAQVDLGQPILFSVVDGQIIATSATVATTASVGNPQAIDLKLFQGAGNIVAVVRP